MGDMALHEATHAIGYALHYEWSEILPPVERQGIIVCDDKGMHIPDGLGLNFFGVALPLAIDMVLQDEGQPRDTCVSRADRADGKIFDQNASLDDKLMLHLFARLAWRQGFAKQIAGHLDDRVGLARIDMRSLCKELRSEIDFLRPYLRLPSFMLKSMIDHRPYKRLHTKFEACEVSREHYTELRDMASKGWCPNAPHTRQWVAAQKALPMKPNRTPPRRRKERA